MIQDIYPRIYHNEYHDVAPSENDFVLVFHKNTVLIRYQNQKLRYPSFRELAGFDPDYHYLFSIDNYKYFLAGLPAALSPADNRSISGDVPVIELPGYAHENVRVKAHGFCRYHRPPPLWMVRDQPVLRALRPPDAPRP